MNVRRFIRSCSMSYIKASFHSKACVPCIPPAPDGVLAEELSTPCTMQDFVNSWRIAQQGCLRFRIRRGLHDRVVLPERLSCTILIAYPDGMENGLLSW